MKPTFHSAADKRRPFPPADYCFHSGIGELHGYSSPDDDESSEFRKFYRLNREFFAVSARERATEMWVFGVVVLTAAWPVVYMIVTVLRILLKGRPPG
jgi:hypothetical protein